MEIESTNEAQVQHQQDMIEELVEPVETFDHFQAEYTIVQENINRTSSTVWRYFGSLQKNGEIIDKNHVYCSQCFDQRKTKKYQKSTSTGNLLKHLKKGHQIVVEQPMFRVKREKSGAVIMMKSEPKMENIQYCKCFAQILD